MNSSGYRNYLLIVLMIVLAFNYSERLALGLVLQNIKIDLHLSDTELGFLSGMAFASFYAVMGIPIARWADGGDRVTIITVTTALWSVAVALCAMAGNFLELLLIRIGAAVGEAGCIPPALSLISDYFSRSERPRAVAIYMLGSPLSFVVGYFLAGWLNQSYGWRIMFGVLGLPGFALAALVWFTLREPRRSSVLTASSDGTTPSSFECASSVESIERPEFRTVAVGLWANITFRHLLFSYAVMSFFSYGILQWQATFLIRSYGLKTGELGTWLAAVYGVGGALGTYFGGAWASSAGSGKEPLQFRYMAGVYAGFGLVTAFIYLTSNYFLAFGLMGLAAVVGSIPSGPLFAAVQTLVSPRMRATSMAIFYLFTHLIGMGLGPLAAGALSDALRPWVGEQSLRYALLAFCPGYMWGGWHFWHASKTVLRDLEAAQQNFV